jgi:predicted kinase
MKLQVLVGMIASGKSTYARFAAHQGVLCMNDDAIVNMLHADDYTLYSEQLKILYKSVENHVVGTGLAMGRPVLVDRGLNVSKNGRQRWLSLAKSFDVPCEAIVFENAGPQVHARRRTTSDPRGHTFEYWSRVAEVHNSLYILPSKEEGFDAIHYISYDEIKQGKVIL